MSIRRFTTVALLLAAAAGLGGAEPAQARTCEGVVHGLSRNYNPATGSGFLAVRAGPRAAATQTGELFNGDRVEIFSRRGNWYNVAGSGIEGWASARYIRNSCGY